MRISGQLGGHRLWVPSAERTGWPFLSGMWEGKLVCSNISFAFLPTLRWSRAQRHEKPQFWVLNQLQPSDQSWFFLKGHRDSRELALSHDGFSQRILFCFHYSWRLFSEGALNHAESTPVCLLQEEPCGTRESARAAHSWEACFHLHVARWKHESINGSNFQ